MSTSSARLRAVAVIPARGGSKGVPGKNLRRIAGRSLLARAIEACRSAALIDAVYVSTDDEQIAAAAMTAGAAVIARPAELADDRASSESALLHALDELDAVGACPDVLAFVQCTSPFIRGEDLDAGVSLITSGQADSAFSGVPSFEFWWRDVDPSGPPGSGPVSGINHDPRFRPRRQDRRPDFRETGAFYVMRVADFRAHRHRFFGRIGVVSVPELTALEIDAPHDLLVADALATVVDAPTPVDVDVVFTDFDGVHTDDTVLVDQDGTEAVRVSRADGMGISLLRAAGVPTVIISKERNPVVSARAAKLGVEVLQAVDDKVSAVLDWLSEHRVPAARAAYLGNDVNDLGPLSLVGWPVVVAAASPDVRRLARLVLTRTGGDGAVRELCDRVLAARAASPGPPAALARPAAAAAVEPSAAAGLLPSR